MAYKQFLDRKSLYGPISFHELYEEFMRLFENYQSLEAARSELETLCWDMNKQTPEQFVASIQQLCRIAHPTMASALQDHEAGTMLMSRIPIDIKSLVRVRASETDDITVLHSTLRIHISSSQEFTF